MRTAILAIILFSLLIFPHELGHFLAAKKFDVKVNEFSFGMGPKLWGKQKGETFFAIRLIPIGGYCALEGEDEESENPRAFVNKKSWQKLIILVAGAFMNMVIAVTILFLVYVVNGQTTKVIGDVSMNDPAYMAGVKVGDVIEYIDDNKVKNWNEIGEYIAIKEGKEIVLTVKRNKEELRFNIVPNKEEVLDDNDEVIGYRYYIGVISKVTHNPILAVGTSFKAAIDMVDITYESLAMLFKGEATMKDLAGPIGVVQIVDETKSYGLSSFLLLVALLSVNIGLVNLLPLPALDGGRVILVLYTMITKREVSKKVEATINAVGLVLLLALAAIVAGNDISRIFM